MEPAIFLKTIKYSASALCAFMIAGTVTIMVLARGTGDDITGVVAPALFISIVSGAVAIAAGILERRAKNSIY